MSWELGGVGMMRERLRSTVNAPMGDCIKVMWAIMVSSFASSVEFEMVGFVFLELALILRNFAKNVQELSQSQVLSSQEFLQVFCKS
jgi:hypothetical protein